MNFLTTRGMLMVTEDGKIVFVIAVLDPTGTRKSGLIVRSQQLRMN